MQCRVGAGAVRDKSRQTKSLRGFTGGCARRRLSVLGTRDYFVMTMLPLKVVNSMTALPSL